MRNVGTITIEGIASGLNTTNIIKQLAEIQRRPIQRLEAQKSKLQEQLTAFQAINLSLGSLRLAAMSLSTPREMIPYKATVRDASGETHLVAAARSSAQSGTYEIVVEQLASAHKIASQSVASADQALGYSGDIMLNGKVISVTAGQSLQGLRDAINQAEAGVTATILQVSDKSFRLVLSAKDAGAENAIQLVDANGTGILRGLGLLDGNIRVRQPVTDGAQSFALENSALQVAQILGLVIPPAGTVFINGKPVAVDLRNDSLEDIRDRINATPDIQATASIVTEEVGGELKFSLQIVGEGQVPTFEDDGGVLQALGILAQGVAGEVQAAQDAVIRVDGITVSRPSNAMDDVISGVNLQLVKADPGQTIQLTVGPDLDAAVSNVQSFVNAYNQVVDKIAEALKYDTEKNQGGLLFGNSAVLNLQGGLRRALTGTITMTGERPLTLFSVGLTTGADGKLGLNAAKLRSALESNPAAVSRLFGLDVRTNSNSIEYVSSASDTQESGPNGYVVRITQAAEQATASSAELPNGITVTETLKFNDTHPITLTAGMSLTQARDHLNQWFRTYNLDYKASVNGNRLQIKHSQYGSAYRLSISSSLARGVGGTDLGGAEPNQSASYVGKDVQGTINGEPAVGSGQYLTGASTNATTAGLKLRIATSEVGEVGAVYVAKGAASRIADYIKLITDTSSGVMTRGSERINSDIKGVDEAIQRMERRVEAYIQKMQEKFQSIERVLAKAQALQEYMTGQIANLSQQSRRK